MLDLLPAGQKVKVVTLMGFNPSSDGGLMGIDFLATPGTATVADALVAVHRSGTVPPEALSSVHAVDDRGRSLGTARVVTLLQSNDAGRLADVCDGSFRRWEAAMLLFIASSAVLFPLAFLSRPAYGATVRHMLVPGIQGGVRSDAILVIIAIVGTTVAPGSCSFSSPTSSTSASPPGSSATNAPTLSSARSWWSSGPARS